MFMKEKGFAKAALAAGILFLGGIAAFSSYGANGSMEDARKQVSAMEDEKKKVENTLNQLESLKDDTAAYVKELDKSLDSLSGELSGLEVQIRDKEAEIDRASSELESAKAAQDRQYSSMKLRIQYIYENEETNFADMMMESRSVTELLNRAEYVSRIEGYDRRMLKKYAAAREDVSAREASLKEEREGLLELQKTIRAKQTSVNELMESKKAELTSYRTKIASAQSEIEQYNQDIKAQEDQMKRIEAEMKRKEEEARKKAAEAGKTYTVQNLGNISFKWPCPGHTHITSGFGERESPTEGASSFHKGIDISAPSGTDITAAADGEVVISTYSYSAGNYIMLDHGGGVSTVYMHCSQLMAGVGDKVKQGQVIAKVGSTGYSTGSHLHFGIRSGGTYVNPCSYVSP